MRAILNGLPALVGYWDAQLRNRMANDAYVEYFGLAPEQIRGMHIRDVLGPQLFAQNEPYIERALAGEPQLFDRTIVDTRGVSRYTQASYIPDTADGAVRGFFVLVTDITPRREAEEARAAAEARSRALFDSAPIGTFIANAEGRFLDVNPAGAALLGYTREQLLAASFVAHTHPDDRAASSELFARLVAGEIDSYRVEKRYLHADGHTIWAQLDATALRGATPDGLVVVAQIQDISARKRAEQVVRRAKEEAERANSAKSDFLSRMSHELRTPLHAILGFGELLERGDLDATQRSQLDQITKGGRHLLDLINEVLDLSRIERGRLALSVEPVHVGSLLRETLDMVAPLAVARSIVVDLAGAEELETHLLADRQRLKQVLLNLLSNAVKYNREGGVVMVRVTAAGSPRARLEIEDTGVGIAPDDLERAFEAFERLGAEATKIEGTGLGLALSRRLIEAMDGEIGVASELGSGSTFWIELPVVAAPQTADARPAPPAETPRRARPRTSGTVLYIEDNPSNIKLVEGILMRRPEITLLVATQGGIGLELARVHRPAVILLDLNLPDMSGEAVLGRIREDPRTAGAKVVMVTADATAGQVARLRAAGADGYLTKPFGIEQLLDVVEPAGPPGNGSAHWPQSDESVADVSHATAPLDLDRLEKLRRVYSDRPALEEFVELFVRDTTARLGQLAASARDEDSDGVWHAAHSLRGSCTVTGARHVVDLLTRIEQEARDGSVPDEQLIAELEAAYHEAEEALARAIA